MRGNLWRTVETLDTGRFGIEGGEPSGEGDLQILDHVAHLLPPAILEIVKSHACEDEARNLRASVKCERAEPKTRPGVTRAARRRAERARRAIHALQIAGLWPA